MTPSASSDCQRILQNPDVPSLSPISEGRPRRCHFGKTCDLGANVHPFAFASLEARAFMTTCSSSSGWIEHVEYTTFLTEETEVSYGMRWDIHLKACWIICNWNAASFSSLSALPSASSCSDRSAFIVYNDTPSRR